MFQLFGREDEETLGTAQREEEFEEDNHDEDPEAMKRDEIGQIALDVLENHESVYILAPVAGIELSDIDISVHETTLTLSGVRNKPKEFYAQGMQVQNQECFWGRFLRKIILPDNMDFSQIEAVMENNLLVIHIPKIRFDSKTIKINRVHS